MRIILTLLIFFCASISADDKRDISLLLDGLHSDAARSDFDSYFNRFSPSAYFLGTDATERWNIEAFKQYAKPIFDKGGGWRYRLVERNIHRSGHTAWFDEQLDNDFLGRCRGTGVVIQAEGRWKIIHYSLTLLVPNKIAGEIGTLTREAMANAEI